MLTLEQKSAAARVLDLPGESGFFYYIATAGQCGLLLFPAGYVLATTPKPLWLMLAIPVEALGFASWQVSRLTTHESTFADWSYAVTTLSDPVAKSVEEVRIMYNRMVIVSVGFAFFFFLPLALVLIWMWFILPFNWLRL